LIAHTYKHRILRALCAKPCNVRTFSDGVVTLIAPVRHIEACLDEMLADGLIRDVGNGYFVGTDAGLAEITRPTTVAASRAHCSANMPVWVPPKWEPVRKGADAHRAHRSHGVGC
jgi:hypothetical protein